MIFDIIFNIINSLLCKNTFDNPTPAVNLMNLESLRSISGIEVEPPVVKKYEFHEKVFSGLNQFD